MKKIDLVESAIYDDLPYRLDLSIDNPFGLEIEAGLLHGQDQYYICNKTLEGMGYLRKTDSSVGGDFPLEIETPVLSTSKELWNTLLDLSKRMKKCKIDFSKSAFQVNMDVVYGYDDIYNLLMFFRTFEHVLYRFSRSFMPDLRDMYRAQSIGNYFKQSKYRPMDDVYFQQLVYGKFYALAFKYKEKTPAGAPPDIVEFRTPNGCDDAWVWQNYINTFYNLCEYILYIDRNMIDYSVCKGEMDSLPYDRLWLGDAIYFADTIFKNEIDKIYFLKQYIGNDIALASNYIKERKLA